MAFAVFILVFGGWNMSKLSMDNYLHLYKNQWDIYDLALPLSGITTMIYNALNISDIVKELSGDKNKQGSKIV